MNTKVALFVLLAVAFTFAEEEAKPKEAEPAKAEAGPTVLSEAWDDIDNNNDNKADKKEWEYYFEEHGLKPLADKSFEEVDKDHDGFITEKEYEAWAKGGK